MIYIRENELKHDHDGKQKNAKYSKIKLNGQEIEQVNTLEYFVELIPETKE